VKILVLNGGSSSQKSCLYDLGKSLPSTAPEPLWEAQLDWTGQQSGVAMTIKTAQQRLETTLAETDRPTVVAKMLATLTQGETQVLQSLSEIDAVGHRVVHGGQDYQASTRITPEVKATIARLSAFAPIHNPVNLEGISAIEAIFTQAQLECPPQVAVFDTAFHARMPPAAALYPGPYEWVEHGIRRYGFHGTSHQYCAQRAAQILQRDLASLKLITCHLGNGCSLAAIRDGYSVDTTMGFTPLAGLMMGTRSGDIDPGILIHLLRQGEQQTEPNESRIALAPNSADDLDRLLNKSSGLLGISGVSSDLRQINAAIAAGNARAQLALDLYIHQIRRHVGAMLMSLNGLDALIFTAGVGENAAHLRSAVCDALAFLGLKLDPEKNQGRVVDRDIAHPDSTVRVLVIHTQEDWAIASECWRILSQNSPE